MSIFGKRKRKSASKGEMDSIPKTTAPSEGLLTDGLVSYHVGNMQGFGSRANQEDSFAFANFFDVNKIKEEGALFVVCDGMGGMKDGKAASEKAIASIRNSFAYMDRSDDIARQLKESVYRASEEVEDMLEGEGGSTVVAGIIYDNKLYYASVGDSYFYLMRNDHLYRLNLEHNMCNQIYQECIQDGCINPDEGRSNHEAAALTQFLGMPGLSDVDGSVRPLPIKQGDVFLACSDGVGGVLDESEVMAALSCETPHIMCEQLEQRILMHQKKNQDNYTAIVVKCCI
jgi:protein phosphatase